MTFPFEFHAAGRQAAHNQVASLDIPEPVAAFLHTAIDTFQAKRQPEAAVYIQVSGSGRYFDPADPNSFCDLTLTVREILMET